jgi:hypothetical protein
MKVGGGEWEGGYEGAEAFGERDFWKLWGKEAFSQIRDYVFWFVFFWFGVWVDCYRGASVAGSFWLGGQESSQNIVTREPNRLWS